MEESSSLICHKSLKIGVMFNMNDLEVDLFTTMVVSKASIIMTLAQCGFFDMKNGSMTFYFGNEGTIKKIEKHNVITLS